MRLLKTITIISIGVIASLCVVATGVNFILTSPIGTKLILTTLISSKSLDLQLQTGTIKINWLNLFTKQQLSIVINNLQGTLNNYPLEANINFATNFFIKKPLYLNLNTQNFIKIGDNILTLEQSTDAKQINFKLIANQLDVFNNIFNNQLELISGKIIITGSIHNNFTNLAANIKTELLNINNIALDPILETSANQLNIVSSDLKTIEAKFNFQDITHIMKFVPSVTRLKGKLQGLISIDNQLNFKTDLALKDITMSLPEYGVKIKPLNINFTGNDLKTIFISGKGVMRNGPGEFKLKGYMEPFSKNFSNSLEIYGDYIECVNIPGSYIIASLKLKLMFLLQQHALQIAGDILIPSGSVNIDQRRSTSIIKSNDIVFIEQTINQPIKNNFRILPNINLRIEPEAKFKLLGKGLDAAISGKLTIYTENDTVLGNGRITIREGTYSLSGQEFIIDKGRMIYLPGTLIANPSLDIKISPKNKQHDDQYVYIEGSLNNPIIKDRGLVNEHQAMLQILSLGSDKIITNIKEKFNLHELGVQEDNYVSSKYKVKNHDESLLYNKHFVIGKKLNKKIDLQYLKTLNTTNNTVRLKYNLSPHWSIGIETSTESGHGADLRFSLEK